MLESTIGFRRSCGAKEQIGNTGNTREWEKLGKKQEYCVQRKEQWIFSAYTLKVVLWRRIMGFRCYSEAADVSTGKGPKLGINLTLTHHTMASEITGARCAISDKCSVADFNTPLSLLFSHVLSSPLQSLSVKWRTGERAKCLCLLTGASEHLKWQRVTLAWVLEKMPPS